MVTQRSPDDAAEPEPEDVGGDPACWAHLFDDDPGDDLTDAEPEHAPDGGLLDTVEEPTDG